MQIYSKLLVRDGGDWAVVGERGNGATVWKTLELGQREVLNRAFAFAVLRNFYLAILQGEVVLDRLSLLALLGWAQALRSAFQPGEKALVNEVLFLVFQDDDILQELFFKVVLLGSFLLLQLVKKLIVHLKENFAN